MALCCRQQASAVNLSCTLVGKQIIDLLDKSVEIDGRRVELVATGRQRLLAGAGHGMCGERNDRNMPRLLIGLEPAGRFPAVYHGKIEVPQDNVGHFGYRLFASDRAILGDQDLEPVEQFEPHLQHVDVVVVVLDIKDFGHEATSGTFCDWRVFATYPCTIATSWAGSNESFNRIPSTPELRRARSAAVRSRDGPPRTGRRRHAGRSCSAVMSWNPSISGIMRSSKMISGTSSPSRSSATRPFSASLICHCCGSNQDRIRSRCVGSSSTRSTHVRRTRAWYGCSSAINRSRSIGLVRYPAAPRVMPLCC